MSGSHDYVIVGGGSAGCVLANRLSEEARKAVMDKLFGAEEEFEYTSTTTGSSSPQTAAAPTTNAS